MNLAVGFSPFCPGEAIVITVKFLLLSALKELISLNPERQIGHHEAHILIYIFLPLYFPSVLMGGKCVI